MARDLIHRNLYAGVGIDPEVGRKAAPANRTEQTSLKWPARKLVPFLRRQGIVGGPTERPV